MSDPIYFGPRQSVGSPISTGGGMVYADLTDWVDQKEKELGFSEEDIARRLKRMSGNTGEAAAPPRPPFWPQPPFNPLSPLAPPNMPKPPQVPWGPTPGTGESTGMREWLMKRAREVLGADPIFKGGPKVKIRPVNEGAEAGKPGLDGFSVIFEWPF